MASVRKNFFVVQPTSDGGATIYAMKAWLRQNPSQIPEGLDPSASTSHQLRAALIRKGWSVQETDNEVRLIPPGVNVEDSSVLRSGIDEVAQVSDSDGDDPYFGLEYQLRDFLAQNLSSISVNGQRLKVYVDPTDREGVEFPTAVGPIDILAVDDKNNFYVFELKRGRTPDYTIGQLARYMGWVKQTIGKDVSVNGIIVSKQISDNLRYAVLAVPNVSLFEYEVSFKLNLALAIGAAKATG